MFFGDIQRLVRREYDIDFLEDVVKQGKIRSIIADSSEFKPEGARSFLDIVEEATAALAVQGFDVVIMIRENNAPISDENKENLLKHGIKFASSFTDLD